MAKKISNFRKEKRAIWQKLSEEIGADFILANSQKQVDTIQAYHKNWTIIIDTFLTSHYGTQGTRIRAPYVNRDGFYFRIYRADVFKNFATKFGLQDIVIGHTQFDKDFIIQGNDEQKLRELFDNDYIRRIISWQPAISLSSNVG